MDIRKRRKEVHFIDLKVEYTDKICRYHILRENRLRGHSEAYVTIIV